MSRDDTDHAELECTIIRNRDHEQAVLVEAEGDEVWIPRSTISGDVAGIAEGEDVTLMVEEWLLIERGLA